ncbi:MAG: hypothetical protein C0505_18420 [Leptothrix sp. (in: Bacteria)]|nr:hypothetical protein [Leptothrix sp. (in: b-proteobacteria)]
MAQRRGVPHCGAAACRQRAHAATLQAGWQRVAALAVQQASALQPSLRERPPVVLWLRPAQREMEPVGPALRESLATAWRAAVAEGHRHDYAGRDSATALPDGAHALCAQCGGACCTLGGGYHAFVDADVIGRWQAAHDGAGAEAAIADYLARLPEEHVHGACGFQAAGGCVLPRELRADVCNRYVCEPLQALGDALADDKHRAAVVLTADGRRLERAALLQRGQRQPLPGLAGPGEAGA